MNSENLEIRKEYVKLRKGARKGTRLQKTKQGVERNRKETQPSERKISVKE
jgi:hypothetical protein